MIRRRARGQGFSRSALPSALLEPAEVDGGSWLRMARLAGAGRWRDYLAFAREAGSLFPGADSRELGAEGLGDAFSGGMERWLASGGSPRAALEPLLDLFDAPSRASLLEELLWREARESSHSGYPSLGGPYVAALMELGADPLGARRRCAPSAARVGNRGSLHAMLRAGMDPNGRAPGAMPLLLEALTKERAFAMTDKMACARALWEAGARLDPIFVDPRGPSCLLELAMSAESRPEASSSWDGVGFFGPPDDPPPPSSGLAEFVFPYAYFDEAGIPPSALLPAPGDEAGRARMLARLRAPDPSAEEFDGGLAAAAPLSGPGWRRRAENYPWLAVAFDLLELGQATPSAPARPARTL